jgi:hypothetical protein
MPCTVLYDSTNFYNLTKQKTQATVHVFGPLEEVIAVLTKYKAVAVVMLQIS